MKRYFKRTILFYLFNTLAIFAGELIAAIPVLIVRAVFETDAYTTDSNLITGIFCEVCIVTILLYQMRRDSYETRQFSLQATVLPAITVCVIRWIIWYLSKGEAAFWVTGGATYFTRILFPDVSLIFGKSDYVLYHLISTIICDILITIPAFLVGGYWGYRRRINENKRMIQDHEQHNKP